MLVTGSPGRGRFELRGTLGAGAFGSVFAAYDRERERMVALKRPHQASAESLVRFKREFRAAAELEHANVVSVYELFEDRGAWFYSMELIDGVPLTAALGGGDGERLRAGFGQLAAAIEAIHAAGVLHGDLKPANVLVTREGRVVVLDFGGSERPVAGAPVYMSPETWFLRHVGEDSDWFGVGVMLYECLTGARPFAGELFEMMQAKAAGRFTRARERCAEVPEPLDAACTTLLDPRAERRREGARLLRAATRMGREFVGREREQLEARGRGERRVRREVVGRERELARLAVALRGYAGGAVVHVVGAAGVGETGLCEEFAARAGATVLRGRCHGREAVPYGALDAAIDELSQELRRRDGAGVWLRRAELAALVRTFPVFDQVFGTDDMVERGDAGAAIVRRHAVQGLREVLKGLSRERPVVLWLDDVGRGDADSAAVLGELLRGADPPRLLVVLTYRPGEEGAFLRELAAPVGRDIVLERGAAEPGCSSMVDGAGPNEQSIERLTGQPHRMSASQKIASKSPARLLASSNVMS